MGLDVVTVAAPERPQFILQDNVLVLGAQVNRDVVAVFAIQEVFVDINLILGENGPFEVEENPCRQAVGILHVEPEWRRH